MRQVTTIPSKFLKGEDASNPGYVGAKYNLVSGAGSQAKLLGVSHGDDTLFAHQHTGFMVVDVMRSGEVFLRVIEPEDSESPNPEGRRVYATRLQ